MFAKLEDAHRLAGAINRKRAGTSAEGVLEASQLNAMGLIHEICHAVLRRHRATAPEAFAALRERARAHLGEVELDRALTAFVTSFPPPSVYRGDLSPEEYLRGASDGISNVEWVLEELVLLWLSNENRGYAPIAELISDKDLRASSAYLSIVQEARAHFDDAGPKGPAGESILDLLMAPMRSAPESLIGQLDFMREHWGLEVDILQRVYVASDFVKEEGKWFLRKSHVASDDAPAPPPPTFGGEHYESEPEHFSPDLDWMPRVVMIAKSAFVWLDQLSRWYSRPIARLSDIPDEELDLLASRGISALWLIGVWRRSDASLRIKQLTGNPEAVASAYSLYDYEIAPELGGYEAYANLRDRAWRRKIRLASDMVPNHMGIDSRWVIEHPERFIQVARSPFPGYTFNGEDLSRDARVGIFLEDGYWNRSDAAVVFKRVDRQTGDAKLLYHGNDGTSMPWNDTAQLDYTRADVRESVIQTILHVARLFPIIRFDAAMTLAKKHYQRLWFPVPGSGGDIPSRAEHAMSKEKFDELFPVEFWREVVDRVALECPDTLLLAEAFWMMEGYFVRTLGMHRVYNSAFMHMLKREDNVSFRTSIKNVLEYGPQILKRHVNFMSNPDEETAIAQFGKDDRYFGVCVLMTTMPGLPMFGHGQIEGFSEKYGMEYKRAYKDERADGGLVARHEREIFPLLKKRALFSDVAEFSLYDFVSDSGTVDEDVIAYSNRRGAERALVVVHNRYKDTRGWIRTSAPALDANGALMQRSLGEALEIRDGDDAFTILRDHVTGLEYIRENKELRERGLELELGAFQYRVFWQLREVQDSTGRPYRALAESLKGRGAASIEDALTDVILAAVHVPFFEAIAPGSIAYLRAGWDEATHATKPEVLTGLRRKLSDVLDGRAYMTHAEIPRDDAMFETLERRFEAAQRLARPAGAEPEGAPDVDLTWAIPWMFVDALETTDDTSPVAEVGAATPRDASVIAAWHLDRVIARALREAGLDESAARRSVDLIALIASSARESLTLEERIAALLTEAGARAFLGVHEYGGVEWLKKEAFEELARAAHVVTSIDALAEGEIENDAAFGAWLDAARASLTEVLATAEEAGYRWEALRVQFTFAPSPPPAPPPPPPSSRVPPDA